MTRKLLLAALTGILFLSCQPKPTRVATVIDGFAQGSTYHIVLVSDRQLDIQPQIDSLLDAIDSSLSLYNPESRLCRINRNETDSLDTFITDCIIAAERVSRESEGRYDITIKPVTGAYGFAGGRTTQYPNLDSLMRFVGYEKISVRDGRLVKALPNMELDLNSIAQGYTADAVAAYLDRLGLTDYLVEVGGGEIFCRGLNPQGQPWRVGIDRPIEGNIIPGADLQERIGISDKGLATSGNYRKFYVNDAGQKIVHTIDARTGECVISNLLSATVLASDATQADAYGTVLMILGLDESIRFLREHPQLEAFLIYSDEAGNLQTYMTPGMEKLVIR